MPDPNELVQHLRSESCSDNRKYTFTCGEEGCGRYYPTDNSLYKHLSREHTFHEDGSASMPNACEQLTSDVIMLPCSSASTSEVRSVHDFSNTGIVLPSDQKHIGSMIYALYSNPLIPRNCIQVIMTEFQSCLTAYNLYLLEKLSSTLSEKCGILPIVAKREIGIELIIHSELFALFKSEHRRFKFFECLGTLIKPIQHRVGCRREFKMKRLCVVPCHIQIIPIEKVLTRFLSMKGVLTETLKNIRTLDQYDESVVNLLQAKAWKTKCAQYQQSINELHLPIIVYFDDMEVNNPLGSHASIHKLGAVYISLPFLPRKYSSLLNCILMLSLFHASDKVSLGNRMIFGKVVDTLNQLSLKRASRSQQGNILVSLNFIQYV